MPPFLFGESRAVARACRRIAQGLWESENSKESLSSIETVPAFSLGREFVLGNGYRTTVPAKLATWRCYRFGLSLTDIALYDDTTRMKGDRWDRLLCAGMELDWFMLTLFNHDLGRFTLAHWERTRDGLEVTKHYAKRMVQFLPRLFEIASEGKLIPGEGVWHWLLLANVCALCHDSGVSISQDELMTADGQNRAISALQ